MKEWEWASELQTIVYDYYEEILNQLIIYKEAGLPPCPL